MSDQDYIDALRELMEKAAHENRYLLAACLAFLAGAISEGDDALHLTAEMLKIRFENSHPGNTYPW